MAVYGIDNAPVDLVVTARRSLKEGTPEEPLVPVRALTFIPSSDRHGIAGAASISTLSTVRDTGAQLNFLGAYERGYYRIIHRPEEIARAVEY